MGSSTGVDPETPLFVTNVAQSGVDGQGNPTFSTPIVGQTFSSPSTAWDGRSYSDVEVQFVGTPSTPYQAVRSLDGTNFVNVSGYDVDGASYSTITAAGIYSFPGNGYLKFSAGAGSALTLRASA